MDRIDVRTLHTLHLRDLNEGSVRYTTVFINNNAVCLYICFVLYTMYEIVIIQARRREI